MHVPKIQFRFSLLFFEKRNTGFQRSFFNLKGKVNTKVPNFPQLNFGSGLSSLKMIMNLVGVDKIFFPFTNTFCDTFPCSWVTWVPPEGHLEPPVLAGPPGEHLLLGMANS